MWSSPHILIIALPFFPNKSISSMQKVDYNHGHNILRFFDILPNVPFTASETKVDYKN